MGADSKIQWTHHTFNPWIGCAHVSEACRFCYAESERFVQVKRGQGVELWGPNAGRYVTSAGNWKLPLRWNREAIEAGERRRVFCASLADVFEDRRELDEPRAWLFELIERTPGLDWLLLTKRPQNIEHFVPTSWHFDGCPSNVWLGTTAEDQPNADERWSHLSQIVARVRFLSVEPMLGAVTMRHWETFPNWVIVGGESGAKARSYDVNAAVGLLEECAELGIAAFHKQLGARAFVRGVGLLDDDDDDAIDVLRLKTKHPKGGDLLEWPEQLRVREFPGEARP